LDIKEISQAIEELGRCKYVGAIKVLALTRSL
jgi:hypothetical protein